MKTTLATSTNHKKEWHIIDAKGQVLGRMAVQIANLLRGRHKAVYTPHVDAGDYVVIINADKVQLTGNKRQENYYWHTGYPGGIKSRTKEQILDGDHPERVLTLAVKRMLPSNRLSRKIMTNLRVYAGSDHPHEAQDPEILDVKSMNSKNTRVA